jgi:hypothetical protein
LPVLNARTAGTPQPEDTQPGEFVLVKGATKASFDMGIDGASAKTNFPISIE